MTINSVKKFFVVVLVLTIFCTNLLAQQQAEAVPSNGVSSAEQSDGKTVECKSLLIAAGTAPNISAALEDGLDFEIEGKYFAEIDKNHKHFKYLSF